LYPSTGDVHWTSGEPAFVFQEAFLLSGSIADNVSLGQALDPAHLRRALDIADALDFVSSLPDGVETVVGERGVSLSGGQRQRVALARALYKNPHLLLIDDTTSALDPATEQNIIRRLRASDDLSCLIVASRPSTVAVATKVVYVEQGVIRDIGSHEDLLRRSDDYRLLIESYESDRKSYE
jgi:ABC-type multidrug transport system fused ATPase/permease subunit